ncbi:MAG: hypothetical protein ABIH08_00945 [Candidatus Omnitrophota bacterium]
MRIYTRARQDLYALLRRQPKFSSYRIQELPKTDKLLKMARLIYKLKKYAPGRT